MDKYYQLHDQILESMKAKKFKNVVNADEDTIPLYRGLVRRTKREYGAFDIKISVAIEKGGKVVAALGEIDILKRLETTLRSMPESQEWADQASQLLEDSDVGNKIIQIVQANPGISQLELKGYLGIEDQKRISNVSYWLEKVGRIERKKTGNSYNLFNK